MENLYGVLGIPEKASPEEIKKAYRSLSMKYHPDRPGVPSREKFQKINEAYQTLGDPHKKQTYDMQRNNPLLGDFSNQDILNMFFGGVAGSGAGVFPSGARVHIFKNGQPMHMGGGLHRQMQKPSPIIKSMEITLAQAYSGIDMPIEIERWIHEEGAKKMEKERIYVEIPAGMDDNEMIIIRGRGNAFSDTNKGDIKIFIKIQNNSHFQRDGLHLVWIQKLTLKEALAGFAFDIKHLSGKTYTINNSSGKVIHPRYTKVLPHMGMRRVRPHPASPIIGDLIIKFEITFPTHLTTEQQQKLGDIL